MTKVSLPSFSLTPHHAPQYVKKMKKVTAEIKDLAKTDKDREKERSKAMSDSSLNTMPSPAAERRSHEHLVCARSPWSRSTSLDALRVYRIPSLFLWMVSISGAGFARFRQRARANTWRS